MKLPKTPARGTRDILPEEAKLRDEMMAIIMDTYRSYGFDRIETPAIEHLELLCQGEGGDNEKLVFKILKRGDKLKLDADNISPDDLVDMGLRYDLTVPLARYYSGHQNELPKVFKAIQTGPVWRAERPQKGRFRQFHQCDIDIIGEKSILAEIELLKASTEALEKMGFDNIQVRVNDRAILNHIAESAGVSSEQKSALFISLDKLDKLGEDGVKKDLITQGFSEETVSKVFDLISDENKDQIINDNVTKVLEALTELPGNMNVSFDPTLVRGMGYYTGPIFEFLIPDVGYALGGGGRYDEMIGKISGQSVAACGVSLGFERLVTLKLENLSENKSSAKTALITNLETDSLIDVLKLQNSLQTEKKTPISLFTRPKKLGKLLSDLQNHGFTGYVVFGENDNEIKEFS
jgi:histidyl-tRNA synthetase